MENRIKVMNKVGGILLIILSIAVSIPLTIMIFQDGGGPWGFEIIGLPILIPLSMYIFFGVAGLIRTDAYQRKAFIITHFLTFGVGAVVLFFFPVYPVLLVSIPFVLAVAGLISRAKYRYYLLLMIMLAIIANGLLLKWELDFHRSIPIFQLFESREISAP